MWFNSMQREEPYRGLNCLGTPMKVGGARKGIEIEVLHGCRQLVS
jgi:hypothetical protein